MSNPPQRQVITNLRGGSDSITTPSTITPDIPIAIILSLASPGLGRPDAARIRRAAHSPNAASTQAW